MTDQQSYERALGAYLVGFNKLEVKLSEVHFGALTRLNLDHLFRPGSRLVERLVPMEIALTALRWPIPDFALLRTINNRRNDLAHGHLHTDPNTGDLLLEGAHKIKRTADKEWGSVSRESHVELPDLSAFDREQEAMQKVMDQLDVCLAHFWFGDPADI